MSSKNYTAVEWFFSELERMQYFIGNDMLEAYKQAKAMEKQQIIGAFYDGCFDTNSWRMEEYYTETYNK